MKKSISGLALGLLLAAPGAASGAATGGRVKDVDATPIHTYSLHVPANVGATIRTKNLSPGSDTVIHIQSAGDPNGGFVAGNDDHGDTLASRVTLAPVGQARNLKVFVRGYSTTTGGTAQLEIVGTNGASSSSDIVFGGTLRPLSAGLVAGSHVMTVEQQGGSNDTVLLVVSDMAAHAIASDDDDGVDYMSWVHVDEACAASNCRVVVGAYYSGSAGATTLIWDEEAHSPQCDADGTGNALETAVGTDPCKKDTDADGLRDGAELVGFVESATEPPVKLPAYGADPKKKDLFLELDWVACTTPECATQDDYKVPGSIAAKVAAYFAPDILVHMDTGVVNDDPATRTIWGSWGGATRIPAGTAYCQMLSPERVGMFHHGKINGYAGGQADSTNGYCFGAGRHATGAPIVHELAHGLGLQHGGSLQNDVNCKPNYRSPMNYAFMYDASLTQFSRNLLAAVQLNPVSVDETFGFGTSDMAKIGYLKNEPLYLSVGPAGQIDWSRDGGYDPGTIRAPVIWFGASCGQSVAARMETAPSGAWAGSRHVVTGWIRTGGGAARIYQISRRATDGLLQSRWALGPALATCRQNPVPSCAAWTPALGSPPALVPGSLGGMRAPATVRIPGVPERLLVVYPDTQNHLRFQVLTVSANNVETWTPPAFVGSGVEVAGSDPALVYHGGAARLYTMSAGVLQRWLYDPVSGVWSGPKAELWSNGASVVVEQGLGLSTGYQRDSASEQIFAVMQVATPAPPHLVLARYDPATHWVQYPQTIWAGPVGTFSAVTRPGLAYVPFDVNVANDGRFFVGFKRAADDGVLIAMTEGNDAAASTTKRRLRWPSRPIYAFNVWQIPSTGVSLMFDRIYDGSLRASWTVNSGGELFAPLADGIFNKQLKDHNDYALMKARLACSLTRSCQ